MTKIQVIESGIHCRNQVRMLSPALSITSRQRSVVKKFSHEVVYSYFEKGCRKKCARDNPEG